MYTTKYKPKKYAAGKNFMYPTKNAEFRSFRRTTIPKRFWQIQDDWKPTSGSERILKNSLTYYKKIPM